VSYLKVLIAAIPVAWGLQGCYSPDRGDSAGAALAGNAGSAGSRATGADTGEAPIVPLAASGAGDSAAGAVAEVLAPGASEPGVGPLPSLGDDTKPADPLRVRLPAACIGIPYRARLDASAATGDSYALREPSRLPDGLALDALTGEISGIPRGVGRFDVELVDADQEVRLLLEVELEERDTCWLAYISAADGAAQLHFRDVFLDPERDIALPAALAVGEAVVDFKFAPNGRWIAFRVGAESNHHVELYSTAPDVAGGLPAASTRVPFVCPNATPDAGCGVLDYAWSGDSRRLAVVLGGTTPEDYLTAVDVAAPEAPWPPLGQARFLGADIPLDYRDQLVWVGSEWLGLMGVDPDFPTEPTETLYSAFVAADERSFERLAPTSATLERATLREVPSGLLVSNEGTNESVLVSFGADLTSPADDTQRGRFGRVAPSGLLLGEASGDARLQVRALTDVDGAPLESDRDSCSEIVAWSARVPSIGLERIACRSDDVLTIFDYSDPPAQGAADPPPRLSLVARAALSGPLRDVRRAFTASTNWLTFGYPAGGFYALEIAANEADAVNLIHPDSSAGLAIATNRDAVALLGAEALLQYVLPRTLDGLRAYASHGGVTATAERCDELGMARWCGAPHVPGQLRYSADAHSLMFEGPTGVLWLAEMTALPTPSSARQLTALVPHCGLACKGDEYAFQP
jgi:hypothetical protein